MRVAFRADASLQIGTGHVMRCLTLADALSEQGAGCKFVCRAHKGHMMDLIEERGYQVNALPEPTEEIPDAAADLAHSSWLGVDWFTDAQQTQEALLQFNVDWLVVDHYAIDDRWESALRSGHKRIMVIDDLADRRHDCDLLLDQNLGRVADAYQTLIPNHACRLIGPKYSMLRPEFGHWREKSLMRRKSPQLKRILITMGGIDENNVTGHVIDCLKECYLPHDFKITIVMGSKSPWLAQVQKQANRLPCQTEVLVNVSKMAELMTFSDLAIGACGGTAWERCCLGLPSYVFTTAQNQHEGALALQSLGAIVLLSDTDSFINELSSLFEDAAKAECLKTMSFGASNITDGTGVYKVLTHLGN